MEKGLKEKDYWADKNLSWKAKGILSYLLHCNNKATIREIIQTSKDQITSVYSGLNELKAAGYLQRFPVRNELGRYNAYENIATGDKPETKKQP